MSVLKRKFLLAFLPALFIILASIVVNYNLGYFDHWEADQYIHFYLSPGSFFFKIFDNRYTDIATNFRAREFANIFNYFDAHAILWSARLGFVHFLSFTHYISLLLISILYLTTVLRSYRMDEHLPFSLFLYVFLLSPAPFLTGHYFRTSKILISLGIIIGLFCYENLVKPLEKKPWNYAIVQSTILFLFVIVYAIALGTTDELGIPVMIIYLLISAVLILRRRSLLMIVAFGGFLLALIVTFSYREVFGPYVVYKTTGNVPNLWTLDNSQVWNIDNYVRSVKFLFQSFMGNFLSRIGLIGSTLIVLISFVILPFSHNKDGYVRFSRIPITINLIFEFLSSSFFLFGIVLIILSIVVHFMTGTQATFLNQNFPQLGIVYYPLPFATLFFLGGMTIIRKIILLHQTGRSIIIGVISLLIVGNVIALKTHVSVISSIFTEDKSVISAFPIIDAINKPVLHQEDINALHGGKSTVVIIRDLLEK